MPYNFVADIFFTQETV